MSQDPMSIHKYLPRRKGCVWGMNWETGTDTYTVLIVAVQSLSCVRLFATLWIAAHHAPLFSTVSRSLFKFMSIELMMLSNHLILCWPLSFGLQSFLASRSFPMSWLFKWGGQILEPQHQSFQWIFKVDFLQDWLAWSPCSPRNSQKSSLAPQFKSINSLVLSLLYDPTLTSIHDYWKTIALTRWTFVGKVMSLLFSMLSRFVIAFLLRNRHLLIPWLQSPSTVIVEPKKIKSVTASFFSSICMKWWDQMPWS